MLNLLKPFQLSLDQLLGKPPLAKPRQLLYKQNMVVSGGEKAGLQKKSKPSVVEVCALSFQGRGLIIPVTPK